ncbi:MAG: molybdopterin-dependent oxidoreductase [Candidatus Thiodiazotropha sp.]
MTIIDSEKQFRPTACILCSINCGISVEVAGNQFQKIKGDSDNPKSKGYICQKAARLNYYQNHSGRITQPLSKKEDGGFRQISWDRAIGEVADKLTHIRNTHGAHAIAYYGGGGQGNHLCQAYSSSLRSAIGTPYLYTALAQEKTGDFWVNGKLFGKQSCHVTEDIDHADYILFIGTNPYHSHGFTRTRKVLDEIAKAPDRTMIVIDPVVTETAKKADIHLQLKPGTDALLMSAMLGTIIQEGLEDRDFIEEHIEGFDEIKALFNKVPIKEYIDKTGLDQDTVQKIARDFASAEAACVRVDLGIQQSLHSTLNSWLEKLLFLVTGNFGKRGCNNLHTQFVPIVGHSEESGESRIATKVTGMGAISYFFPPNILPAEIDTDHPDRVRALIVDSANPILTAADSNAYIKAFNKLELLVVIDIASTETAKLAHYVLPAQSQFEKWEASFFTLDFPTNYFQLRAPIVEPVGNILAEPEIYRRLLVAMGMLPKSFPLLQRLARLHLRYPQFFLFPVFLFGYLTLFPKYKKSLLMVLYETIGKAIHDGAQNAAVLWGAAHLYAKKYPIAIKRTGLAGSGLMLGERLFKRIMGRRSGTEVSIHKYEEVWDLVRTPDKKISLNISELHSDLQSLAKESSVDESYPYILAAGERRAYNANQIFRTPDWRKKDIDGALRVHPDDAMEIGVTDNDPVLCKSANEAIKVVIQIDSAMQPGFVSLPHGYGFEYCDSATPGHSIQNGPKINMLTALGHCDPISKTPYHKYVPVHIHPCGTGKA